MKILNQLNYTDELGFSSKKTIASHGCYVTVNTMMLNIYSGQNFTPAQVNYMLQVHDGYAKDFEGEKTIIKHHVFAELFNFKLETIITCNDYPAPVKKIIDHLPCAIKVDYNPVTTKPEGHFVLGISHINRDIVIADPFGGKEKLLLRSYAQKDWDLKRAILGASFYKYKEGDKS